MGALSNDGPDDDGYNIPRIGTPIKLYYDRWRWHVPMNPPGWSRMGPREQAEWGKAREVVDKLNAAIHELRCLGLVHVDKAYW